MRFPLDNYTITQGFNAGHLGVDLAAPMNTPIKAPEGGKVIAILNGWKPGDYFGGNYVKMTGNSGYTYYMGHMSKTNTSLGATVKEGQVIGYVGSTGQSTGPHVHFEMSRSGVNYDPRTIIKGDDEVITKNDKTQLRAVMRDIKGWNANNVDAGKHDTTEANAWAGKPWTTYIAEGVKEGASYRKKREDALAYYAKKSANDKALVDEKALNKALNEQIKRKDDEIKANVKELTALEKQIETLEKKLTEQPSGKNEQEIVQNWLLRLWNSLFKKGD